MFKVKMKHFSVYWKEKPYLLFSGHWNIFTWVFFPWYHILCFKPKTIIISVFHGTVLLDVFSYFLHPDRCLSCIEVSTSFVLCFTMHLWIWNFLNALFSKQQISLWSFMDFLKSDYIRENKDLIAEYKHSFQSS